MHTRLAKPLILILWVIFSSNISYAQDQELHELRTGLSRTLRNIGDDIKPPVIAKTYVRKQEGDFDLEQAEPLLHVKIFEHNTIVISSSDAPAGFEPNIKQGAAAKKSVTSTDSAMCANHRYCFRLIKSQRGDNWMLRDIHKLGTPGAVAIEKAITKTRESTLGSGRTVLGIDGVIQLDNLFDDIIPTNAQIVNDPTNKNIMLKFNRIMKMPPKAAIQCEYTFDKSQGWYPVDIKETLSTKEGSRTFHLSQTVSIENNKFQNINATTNHIQLAGKPAVRHMNQRAIYVVEMKTSLAESDFFLPAFGIPEPAEFQPKPTPLYLWLLLAAAVCAVFTIGFRLLARRRAA